MENNGFIKAQLTIIAEMAKMASEDLATGKTHIQAIITHYSTTSMSTVTFATVDSVIDHWMGQVENNIEQMVRGGFSFPPFHHI